MRYRKRKKAAAQVMVMTVAVVAVLAALLVLACSQVFRVRGILIVGNRNLSKEDVIALSGVQRRGAEKEHGAKPVYRVPRARV